MKNNQSLTFKAEIHTIFASKHFLSWNITMSHAYDTQACPSVRIIFLCTMVPWVGCNKTGKENFHFHILTMLRYYEIMKNGCFLTAGGWGRVHKFTKFRASALWNSSIEKTLTYFGMMRIISFHNMVWFLNKQMLTWKVTDYKNIIYQI